MTKEELKEYLIDEAEYSPEEVNEMDTYNLVDAWLTYNGIMGYTEDIINLVFGAYEIDNEED